MVIKCEWYKCYSINLLRFIKAHNIRYDSKFVNKTTEKTCWLFKKTDELSIILKAYTNSKI